MGTPSSLLFFAQVLLVLSPADARDVAALAERLQRGGTHQLAIAEAAPDGLHALYRAEPIAYVDLARDLWRESGSPQLEAGLALLYAGVNVDLAEGVEEGRIAAEARLHAMPAVLAALASEDRQTVDMALSVVGVLEWSVASDQRLWLAAERLLGRRGLTLKAGHAFAVTGTVEAFRLLQARFEESEPAERVVHLRSLARWYTVASAEEVASVSFRADEIVRLAGSEDLDAGDLLSVAQDGLSILERCECASSASLAWAERLQNEGRSQGLREAARRVIEEARARAPRG
ncbi:MAG: hypothetical protein DWQ36_05410 [Acidobacteria bacterium]|nr:MAG: hypothetical protein DWQ36_05410 [Acidobacteriota bacterium]